MGVCSNNEYSLNLGRYVEINEQYKYSDLTGRIIGAAMEVHKSLGNGFQEIIYQRALAIELAENHSKS